MNTHDTLFAYSEWLDSQGLVVADDNGDSRTHDELAKEFIEQWQGGPLAGSEPLLGLATTQHLIQELNVRVHISSLNGDSWVHYRTVDGE